MVSENFLENLIVVFKKRANDLAIEVIDWIQEQEFSLASKIFLPVGGLIGLAHLSLYLHVHRLLDGDQTFQAIVVSILEHNIIGSAILMEVLAFAVSAFLAYKFEKNWKLANPQPERIIQSADLSSLDVDALLPEDFDEILLADASAEAEGERTLNPNADFLAATFKDKIARDFVHPMAAILGHAHLAKIKNSNAEVLKNLEFIETEARRMKKSVEEFVSKTPSVPAPSAIQNLFAPASVPMTAAPANPPRVRKQAQLRLNKVKIENFARFPEPSPNIELPALPPFPPLPREAAQIRLSIRRPELKTSTEGVAHDDAP